MTLERGNSGLSPAVASVTLNWPWGWAVGGGAVAAAANALMNLSPNVLMMLPGALSTGVFFFALIGGGVMFLSGKGDRRARRYAGKYPWRTAMVPAGLGAVGVAAFSYMGLALSGSLFVGLFAAAAAGIGAGIALWLILGLIATVAGNKSA